MMTTTTGEKGMNNLFSINRAADLLERDRATLVRALRHLPPEGYTKHCQPRWSMQTIRNALAVKPQARRAAVLAMPRVARRQTRRGSGWPRQW